MRLFVKTAFGLLLALSLGVCAGGASPLKLAENATADELPGNAEQAKENPYTKSFVNKGRPTIALQPDPEGPRIYRGSNQVADYQRMLENGFDMLGYSSFKGLDVAPELLEQQAKAIKADLVLVYTKQKGSTPLSVQIDQARKKSQGRQDPASGDAPASKDQTLYDYFASYWVKLAPPLIGVHVETYTEDGGKSGLRVLAVVNESPAAKAAIRDGDVLTRIGDVTLSKPEALTQAAQRYAGKTVDVNLQRGNHSVTIPVKLNTGHQ